MLGIDEFLVYPFSWLMRSSGRHQALSNLVKISRLLDFVKYRLLLVHNSPDYHSGGTSGESRVAVGPSNFPAQYGVEGEGTDADHRWL